MLKRFMDFAQKEKLLADGRPVLVATSGGVDSVVLCRFYKQAGLPFAIGHCNFQLRGEASDGDEEFVRNLAHDMNVPFFSNRFDTTAISKKQKTGIQEVARQLRYEWLEKIRQSADYEYIATAHHLDDSIETVLFNFAKGCGIRGMHGILPKKENLIRPLLFATKQELLDFAQSENIAFREDASNLSDKYSRNLIRRHAMPVFEKINPSFQHSAGESIQHLRETEQLFDFFIQKIRDEVLEAIDGGWRIHVEKLHPYPALPTLLFELLRPFGFNNDQVLQILQSVENQSGKLFYSPEWQLLLDRFYLILSQGGNVGGVIEIRALEQSPVALPEGLLYLQALPNPPTKFLSSRLEACLDLGKITWPLTLRRWRQGDSFCPLGMGGQHQKLQDFFSNQKLTLFEKEKVWLLESNGEICWIVGMRLDDRFKVTGATKACLKVTFEASTFATASSPSTTNYYHPLL